MGLIRWKEHDAPAGTIGRFRDELSSLLNAYWGDYGLPLHEVVYPPVNVYEDADHIYMTAELPGLSASDVDIDVESEFIQIKGERKIKAEAGGHYHRRERESGTFLKKIDLPVRIDTGNVTAAMENGVLLVTMGKASEVKPRKIKVKVK